ncbi:MAG: hypothetical protein ACK5LR_10505 [Mangrovibacterium sp.]
MNRSIKIIFNIALLLVVVGLLWVMIRRTASEEKPTYAEVPTEAPDSGRYALASSFELGEEIKSFAMAGEQLFVAAADTIHIYSMAGELQNAFGVSAGVRDIAFADSNVYALYQSSIEIYDLTGNLVEHWEACSDLSDYCSLAVAGGFVFASDAANKNICQYTRSGGFVRFISSPNGFVIPSYSFDMASHNDTLYVANSGRHQIEVFTLEGKFVRTFGKPEDFVGCCNPSYISIRNDGQLLSSEKGIPSIKLFDNNGEMKEILLNSTALGGGNKAKEVKALGESLVLSSGSIIKIFNQRQ